MNTLLFQILIVKLISPLSREPHTFEILQKCMPHLSYILLFSFTPVASPLSAALMMRSFRFLRLMRAVHSSLERLESLVLQLKFSL